MKLERTADKFGREFRICGKLDEFAQKFAGSFPEVRQTNIYIYICKVHPKSAL